jgi:membrane-bound serine protease (ClpP class)
VVEGAGPLDRTMVGYLTKAVATAERDGAEVLVVAVDSAGALGADLETLTGVFAASRTPVVVWVGPSGATALGGAAVLAASAHVLAVAPGTTVGAATPADLRDPAGDHPAAVAARLAELAALHGRSVELARAMAAEGLVVATVPGGELGPGARLPRGVQRAHVRPVDEAGAVVAGFADVVAVRLDDVLRELDGRSVALTGGETRALEVDPVAAHVRFRSPGLLQRLLHTAANPVLAYLLVMAGVLALAFEMFQPGFGVAGVSGLALIALGAYGLFILPTSLAGVVLLAGGVALLAFDLSHGGLGLPTAAGTLAVAAGSWLLFPRPMLALPVWLVVAGTLSAFTFFVLVMTLVLRAQAGPATADLASLEGKVGVVRSMLNPEGHVFVDGALWRARAPDAAGKVRTGTQVRVVGHGGGTLVVQLVEQKTPVR